MSKFDLTTSKKYMKGSEGAKWQFSPSNEHYDIRSSLMHIVLTVEDISKLSHSARAELLSLAFQAHVDTREYPAGFDSSRFEGVVALVK
jgi:hypothetical protein